MIVVDGEEVVAYVERRLGVTLARPRLVRGFLADDGKPLAAVVFNCYTRSDIELTVVAERVTRGVIRYVAGYVFDQLGCRRATVRTKKKNKYAQKMALRCGFKFESVARHYFVDDDAVVFRMLRHECRWTRAKTRLANSE
jgi:hypothetical protein